MKDSEAITDWVDVDLELVGRPPGPIGSRAHVVILRERAGARRLAIYVGASEAAWLNQRRLGAEMPRPDPYDLMAALVNAGEVEVQAVRVRGLHRQTFLAEVCLGNGTVIDTRPSDALNLALALSRPIRVHESLLADEAMQALDPDVLVLPEQVVSSTPEDVSAFFRDEHGVELGPMTVDRVVAAWWQDVSIEVAGRGVVDDIPKRVTAARTEFQTWLATRAERQ